MKQKEMKQRHHHNLKNLVYKLLYIREEHDSNVRDDATIIEWHISGNTWTEKDDAIEYASHVAQGRKVELLRWNSETDSPFAG